MVFPLLYPEAVGVAVAFRALLLLFWLRLRPDEELVAGDKHHWESKISQLGGLILVRIKPKLLCVVSPEPVTVPFAESEPPAHLYRAPLGRRTAGPVPRFPSA